jgi:hypothetical protein
LKEFKSENECKQNTPQVVEIHSGRPCLSENSTQKYQILLNKNVINRKLSNPPSLVPKCTNTNMIVVKSYPINQCIVEEGKVLYFSDKVQ